MEAKERLTPVAAVSKLSERVKKIGKVNSDIADWLQVQSPGSRIPAVINTLARSAGKSRKRMSQA